MRVTYSLILYYFRGRLGCRYSIPVEFTHGGGGGGLYFLFNSKKTGIGEVIAIFRTINDQPGLQGTMAITSPILVVYDTWEAYTCHYLRLFRHDGGKGGGVIKVGRVRVVSVPTHLYFPGRKRIIPQKTE